MSFDFSDLVIPEDVNETDFFNYENFLSDPIYDWLNKPEEVLNACADLEKEIKEQNKPKQKIVTIIQQPQPAHYRTGRHKKVSYRRGPYRKKNQNN